MLWSFLNHTLHPAELHGLSNRKSGKTFSATLTSQCLWHHTYNHRSFFPQVYKNRKQPLNMNLSSPCDTDFITDISAKYLCFSHDALMSQISQLSRRYFISLAEDVRFQITSLLMSKQIFHFAIFHDTCQIFFLNVHEMCGKTVCCYFTFFKNPYGIAEKCS